MLIHKATMGVLDQIWTGEYRRSPSGGREPLERQASMDDVDDPEHWWEIPGNGPLAKRLRTLYPCCDPVVGEAGELLDVRPWAQSQEEDREAHRQKARSRGYRSPGRVRPENLMPFLKQGGPRR